MKVKFQAEQPDEPPAREVMERFKAIGLPTYVILRPSARAANSVRHNRDGSAAVGVRQRPVMDETPALLAAFGAGFCSLISPGVAPLLPAFAGFAPQPRAAGQLIAFLCGFSLVFVTLGAGATAPGQALLEHLSFVEGAAGVFLIAVGLRGLGMRGLTGRASAGRRRRARDPGTPARGAPCRARR